MFDAGLEFDFDKGLGLDFGNTEWDLIVPSRTTMKDNSSGIGSLLLSINTILAPSDIHVVFVLPSDKNFLYGFVSVP